MNEDLKNRIKNYQQKPPKASWEKINSKIVHHNTNWLKILSISALVILVGAMGVMFLTPAKTTVTANSQTSLLQKANVSKQQNQKEIEQNAIKTSETSSSNTSKETLLSKQSNLITSFSINEKKEINIPNAINKKVPYGLNIVSQVYPHTASGFSQTSLTPSNDTAFSLQSSESIKTKNTPSSNEDTIGTRRELFMPNAFTPSKNTNNIIKPQKTQLLSYDMSIYNRNGVMIFHTTNIDEGWNGYYKGKLCNAGSFVYVIKFTNLAHYSHTQKGMINLIR